MMKITEVIKILEDRLNEHGDIEVAVIDADTSWRLKLIDQDLEHNKELNIIEVTAGYGNEMVDAYIRNHPEHTNS